jgi:hypothetical protein
MAQTEENPFEGQPDFIEPETREMVRTGIQLVAKGKTTLSDLFQSITRIPDPEVPDKKPPVPKPLTEAQTKALERLPDVFGKVVVTADRSLTKTEIKTLVEERTLIDTLLTPLETRKKESIREVLSNHLDHLVTEEQAEAARVDAKGHYAVTQNLSVEGTGKKVQRSVSGGKPVLTIEQIEDLHARGRIDRKTYLAITKKPDVPRVMDEEGLHKAIQKDPALFFLLGSVAKPTLPTTTIKVVNDS